MPSSIASSINGLEVIDNISESDIQTSENELENGVESDDLDLVSFKVEQKISVLKAGSDLNIGGFVNSNSKFESLKTRYMATVLSNKTEQLEDAEGNTIATKRYGIGFGLSLDVQNIETKINANYGVLAASAKMDFAKVNYKLGAYAAVNTSIIGALPSTTGEFSIEKFDELKKFITSAKKTLKNPENTKLYPIEFLKEQSLELEKNDIRSIYFGARQVSTGLRLFDAIKLARELKEDFNENVIQFVYRYFGLTDAYLGPTERQRQNSKNWQNGLFNKVTRGLNDSWVEIDDQFTGDFGDPDKNYKPHPFPSDWATRAKGVEDFQISTSADFSSELKISAIADVSGSFNSITLIRNITQFVDISENRPQNSHVIETRYGVGLRLMIKLSNIEFGTDINIATVGAASELSLANVEYEISGFGFAGLDLLDDLPGPQNITQETVSDLTKFFDDIKAKLSQMDVATLKPRAYKVRVNEPERIDPLLEAQSVVFAVRQIRDQKRRDDSVRKAVSLGLNKELVAETYQDFGIQGNDRVTIRQKNEARVWVNIK